MKPDFEPTARQRWMQVLARAGERLAHYEAQLEGVQYQCIRRPETGMAMVRGRMGGTGQAFNLGEMTVTRCVIQLPDGRAGYSYVAGRNKRHAELAAVADALLQGEENSALMSSLISPLAREQQEKRESRQARVAASKVDFFTLVRGENA